MPTRARGKYTKIPDDVKQQLAVDIDEAGGIQNFDKGKKQALDKLLNKPERQHLYRARGDPFREKIRNLVYSQWKTWSAEKHLKQVFIPFVVQGVAESPCNNGEDGSEGDDNNNSGDDDDDEDYVPEPTTSNTTRVATRSNPNDSQQTPTKQKASKPSKTKTTNLKKMAASTNTNELGDKIVLNLDDGLIFVCLWVDTKLDKSVLELLVADDGMSVIMRTKRPSPSSASELLNHYSWSQVKTNFVVKSMAAELRRIKRAQRAAGTEKANEWKETTVVELEEEVVRKTVDIDGVETNQISYKIDAAGRQMVSFFLKTMEAVEAAPAAATFSNVAVDTNNDSSGMDIGDDVDEIRDEMNDLREELVELQQRQAQQQMEEHRRQQQLAQQQLEEHSRQMQQQQQASQQQLQQQLQMIQTMMQQVMNPQPVQPPQQPVVPEAAPSAITPADAAIAQAQAEADAQNMAY